MRTHAPEPRNFNESLKPTSESQWIALGDKLKNWAMLETSLVYEEFPASCGYSCRKFNRWKEENEYFADAIDFAKHTLGARREKLAAFERKMDRDIFSKLHPLYNEEYREWQTNRLSRGSTIGSPLTVLMAPMPDTGIPSLVQKETKD
jgi:hypothetical protein